MQLYTKILIGMLVGAVIGLALGPNSELLSADMYKIANASSIEVYVDRFKEGTRTSLPAVPASLKIKDITSQSQVDATGKRHEVPSWAHVSFKYTKQMALKDPNNVLRKKLGDPKTGKRVDAWLKLQTKPLPGGGFAVWPQPISSVGETIISWLRPVGTIFMRLIKMVIVPLVFASLLVGVASLGDVRKLGRLGGKTLALYILTTAAAVTIGLVCAAVIQPGNFIDEASRAALTAQYQGDAGSRVEAAASAPSAIDNIVGIIPTNPVASFADGNMLQIIFFALIFGIALTFLDGTHGRPVVTFFDRIQEAMILIIHMVMAVAPYGVAALVADVVGTSGLSVLMSLFVYALVVLLGLALHAGLVYGSIVRFIAKLPIPAFLRAARPAQLIAFSTSSSSASLPVTMECAEDGLGVSKSTTSFVIPLGATVNMDGTALYQGVAAMFIAQVFQMDLTIGQQIGIVLTATMASIGAAGVPGAGMVTLALVLSQAGIPTVGVALILGMDRILDMFRTSINVTGDLAVTAAMAVSEGEELRPLSPERDAKDPQHGFEGRLEHLHEHPVEPEDE